MLLRARTALARAGDEPAALRPAERDLARIAGREHPVVGRLARLGRAGVEAARRTDEAVEHLGHAAAWFDRTGMALHAAVARRPLGRLVGGDEGSALVDAAERWMAGEGIASPELLSATIAPGFG